MPLNQHFIPPPPQSASYVGTYLRSGHKDINYVDSTVESRANYFVNQFERFVVEVLTTKANHADLHSGVPCRACVHTAFLLHILNGEFRTSPLMIFLVSRLCRLFDSRFTISRAARLDVV
jgi:hypothetical protein